MWIVADLKKSYDWVPVPEDTEVTKADIAADRVRPAANGGWRMRITKPLSTQMMVTIPEEQIIAKIIHEKCRPEGGRTLTRKEAAAFYISEEHLPYWAKREWITKFYAHDDGPDEAMMRAMLAPHAVSEASRVAACKADGNHMVATANAAPGMPERCMFCGHMPSIDAPAEEPNIPADEHEAHVAAYLEKMDVDGLVSHLHTHFKVKAVKS